MQRPRLRNKADLQRPLHIAAGRGDIDIIRALLVSGANVNAEEFSGKMPLHFAAKNLHVGAVRELLRHGANPNAHDGKKSLLHALLKGATLRHATYDIDLVLEILSILLAAGAGANAVDHLNRTPVQMMLEHYYADRHSVDWYGRARPVLDTLISFGAHLHISQSSRDFLPSTAHYALFADDTELLRVYIRQGGDISVYNKSVATPLYMACTTIKDTSIAFIECLRQYDARAIASSGRHMHVDNVCFEFRGGRSVLCLFAKNSVQINYVSMPFMPCGVFVRKG